MSSSDETSAIKETLSEIARQLTIPVDCDKLVADGVLARRRGWFEVLQPNLLPEHASRQVIGVKTSKGRMLIRFSRSHRRAEALHKKLSELSTEDR